MYGGIMMKKIKILALTLMMMVFPCVVFAFDGPIDPAELTSPIETLFDVSLGTNLENAKNVFDHAPYVQKWEDTQKNNKNPYKYGLFYKHIDNPMSKIFSQVKQEFTIGADTNKIVNQITYTLYFSNKGEYDTFINALNEQASAQWELQDEQVLPRSGYKENRETLHRTWGKDDLHLSIATSYFPEYNLHYPYIVRISRTKS